MWSKVKDIFFGKLAICPYMEKRELDIITEILTRLEPKVCLEWGAGYSTIYFANFLEKRSKWIAIEHDKKWAQKISDHLQLYPVIRKFQQSPPLVEYYFRKQVSRIGLKTINALLGLIAKKHRSRIDVIHIAPNQFPFADKYNKGSYREMKDYIEYPKRFGKFDFILIDGRARRECVIKAHDIINDNGVVVLHDAGREYCHDGFALYKYQNIFLDDAVEEKGLWIGSKALDISSILDVTNIYA